MSADEYGATTNHGNKISTVDEQGKRKWIYAFQPKGKLYQYRTWFTWFYLAIFFALPFIKVNGQPFMLFNIPDGKFILFGQLFFPQDFPLLGIAMLLGLVFIIVFTLVFGRLFCGWVCPQTIFLEMVFRKIEYLIEGPAHKQKQLAQQAKKPDDYYIRKGIKHVIFFIISFIIANTFLSYIIGVEALRQMITEPLSDHVVMFLSLVIFTIIFYVVFAFVRELVCTVICPYGRLQSVLLDKNSIAVTYNYNRGEPRNKKRKSQEAMGDCIDCNMCVNVCPTGIDIRNGLQMECTNCTACIDACNMMMDKVGLPKDLITFASEAQLQNNTVKKIVFNYRSKLYIAVLCALMVLFTGMMISRSTFDATLMRVPGQLFQVNEQEGTVTNLYKIKVVSKHASTLPYHLQVKEPGAEIIYVGHKLDSLKSGVHSEETFFIKMKAKDLSKRKTNIHVMVMSGDKIMQTKSVSFLSGY